MTASMRIRRTLYSLTILLPLGLAIPLGPLSSVSANAVPHLLPASVAPATARFASLPLSFERNVGQAAPDVRYLAEGPGYTLLLTDRGAIMSFTSTRHSAPLVVGGSASRLPRVSSVALGLLPARAARHPRILAAGAQRGKVNYVIGSDPARWHVDIPTFSKVVYRDVYPGIDLVFRGESGGRLEYDWIVRPHADPRDILMRVTGARSVRLAGDGSVTLSTPLGTVRQQAPHLYQIQSGKRVAVAGGFRLLPGGRLALRLDRYDARRTLVVDPQVTFSTFFGTGTDVWAVAVGPSGDIYIAGDTAQGLEMPTKNAAQARFGGGDEDAFVAEISSDGNGLIYSTYLGGVGSDEADALAVDDAGNAHVGGATVATDFPGAPGKVGPFVVRLSPAGDHLVYSHIDPSNGKAATRGIAVDSSGDAYYTGDTSVPGVVGHEMFVRELSPGGTPLGRNYVGGPSSSGSAIALDPSGNVYVAGLTEDPTFAVIHALNPTYAGHGDAFVMELDGGLSRDWSTYLGGGALDAATGIEVDAANNIYVTGYTESLNFPVRNAVQTALKGTRDAFVTELKPFGTDYVYSTYLGGIETKVNSGEQATGIAVDADGTAFVTGYTTAPNFPTVNTDDDTYHGGEDVFLSQLAPGGTELQYSALIGGSQDDEAYAIALGGDDDIFVVGRTHSKDFPLVGAALQKSFPSTSDGFLFEVSNLSSQGPPPPPGSATNTPTSTQSSTETFTETQLPTDTQTLTETETSIGTETLTETQTLIGTETLTETQSPTEIETTTQTQTSTGTGTSTGGIPKPPTNTPTVIQGFAPPPTSTPVPTATATATATVVRAPGFLRVDLSPSKVNAGSKLTITVTTAPEASVTIGMQVKLHGSVVFGKSKHGKTAADGTLTRSIMVSYYPAKKVKARITVQATTAGGSVKKSLRVTILPHA